ncbi:hypothetical protein [Thioalkalivibrio sp. HK1]|uniref:hypothetical protein n=1 Tax=Thioalkalivibrio sp. HK1 TaxID=1469245 RepID=UPI00046EBA11|nr:hypothetical protein [Thioalkalivibrio sp. HK1]
MRRAVFVLIVIGFSIFAGTYFLLNLSKPDNAGKEPPAVSPPAPIDRTLSPTPIPAPASPPPRTEGSERTDEGSPDPGLEEDADSALAADRPREGSNIPRKVSKADEAVKEAPVASASPLPLIERSERIDEDSLDPSLEEDADTALADQPEEGANIPGKVSKAEAIRHIDDLIDPFEKPIPVDEAEHFVTIDRLISLIPKENIERLSLSDMDADEDMTPDTPLTIVHDIEQSERISSNDLLLEHEGDLEAQVEVIEDDRVESISVAEALERMETDEEDAISLIRQERHFEVTTLEKLQSDVDDADEKMSVVRKPYRLESAELSQLIGRQRDEDDDAVFYIHTVRDRDIDGIWGIIHYGLIDNFAAGMNIGYGDITERYRIDIPLHSDELLDDRSSSFLGKLIHEKVRQSIVYNFEEHRIGKNPDRIHPGQELIIVEFQPDELIELYRYFAGSADSGSINSGSID